MESIGIITNEVSGLMTALILKQKFNDSKITVIALPKKSPLGSISNSTPQLHEFVGFVGLPFVDIIKRCDVGLQYGTRFNGWSKEDFLTAFLSKPHAQEFGQYLFLWGKFLEENLTSKQIWHPNIWSSLINKTEHPLQHHFNADKLYKHLIDICPSRDISIIKDSIAKVEIKDRKIVSLKGKRKYEFDLYIDATGFDRKLIKALSPEWISYKKFLPNNAVTFFENKISRECLAYTTVTRKEKGSWFQQIPTYRHEGSFYFYDKNKISSPYKGKTTHFEQGYYKNSWIGNCCSIGKASGFIEPLHGHGIGLGVNQTFLLMHHLPNSIKLMRDFYNSGVEQVYENIKNFTHLTYINQKNFNPTKALENQIEIWKNRLPISEDISARFTLFKAFHFLVLLHGLGFLKKNLTNLLREYKSMNQMLHTLAHGYWNEYKETFEFKGIPHKDFLKFHYH